jgi:4'-phosphopantetheinyl transferase
MEPTENLRIICSREDTPFNPIDPVHRPLLSSSVDLWYAPIGPLIPFRDKLINDLSTSEQERANRFHFEKDRNRFIIGHFLLRNVLAHYLNCDTQKIQFARMEFGKPFVPDAPDLNFNFSDTKDAILIGVTDASPIGVDIETISRDVDHEGVAEHYFTRSEIQELNDSSDPKQRFLEFWTRKESILKASGVGIMDDVRVLQVNQPDQTVTISHSDLMSLSAPIYFVHTGMVLEQNIISVATPQKQSRIRVYDALAL